MISGNARTVVEWESEIGRQARALHLRRNQTQADLARDANVSVSTLAALERGAGSSLSTLVAVVRALDRSDWLDALAPPRPVSPLAALEAQRRQERGVRRRASGRSANRA